LGAPSSTDDDALARLFGRTAITGLPPAEVL
jgi:hypothetical protein